MNFNTITTLIVSVIVVVLISAAALVPIIQAADDAQFTTANNVNVRYSAVVASDSETRYTIAPTSEGIEVNGELIDGIVAGTSYYYVVSTELFTATYRNTDSVLAIRPIGGSTIGLAPGADYLIMESGTASYYIASTDTTTVLGTYDFAIIPDNDGAYCLPNYNSNDVFINHNTTFYAIVPSTVVDSTYSTGVAIFEFDDTGIKSMLCRYVDPDDTTVKTTNDYTGIELSMNNLSAVDSICSKFNGQTSFDTENGTDINNNGYNYVPVEYNYISDQNSLTITLLGIIPLLIFVVPIMLIVRSFYNGRD